MYERHDYPDIMLPIKFHRNQVYAKGSPDIPAPPAKRIIVGSGRAHWHEGIEILRMVEGCGNVHVNTDILTASAGEIAVICSNTLHRVSITEGKCILDCLIINYKTCTEWGFDPCQITYDTLICDDEIFSLFDRISAEFEEKKPHYKSMIMALCMEIMVLLTRNHVVGDSEVDTSATKKAHLTRQIMQYIARNLDQKITLKSISDELKYSHFYLEHIFTELTGLSIREYLTQTRILEAEKLLAGGELSVADIAERCGYSNPAAFSTAFRKKCGISPMEYRKKGQ